MALSSSGTVQNTKKPNAENPNLKFMLDPAGKRYVEFRRSGDSQAYDLSAVLSDNGKLTYNTFVHNDGTYIPGRILGVQEVTLYSSDEKENGQDWYPSVNFTAVSGAKRYLLIPKEANYGLITGLNYSGNTVSARIRNISGETHTITAKVYVVALNM